MISELISVREELDGFSSEELYTAAHESSRMYNGIVLSKAIEIMLRCGCEMRDFEYAMGRRALNLRRCGKPCTEKTLRRALGYLVVVGADVEGCLEKLKRGERK